MISPRTSVYLYLSNPYSPTHRLVIAKVLKSFYHDGKYGGLPDPDEDGRPACAHVPEYYFHIKRTDQCRDCRERKPDCRLRFGCHYWFKIVAFEYIPSEKVAEHFQRQLRFWDSEVGRRGEVFVPTHNLVFPILVEQVQPLYYFGDSLRTIRQSIGEAPIKYQKDHPPEKYGLKDFFRRLARDPYVTRVEVGKEGGVRESFFKVHSADYHVIEGGIALNYRGKGNALLFSVVCHSESREQQEKLRDYFEKEYS